MKLEDIGFYTLSDARAKNTSVDSPLERCELLVTNRCNFKCPYCRGASFNELTYSHARRILDVWTEHRLQNIRFSGGEPTMWKDLALLVERARNHGVKRIAISTNGSADWKVYRDLLDAGANDFSISFDACCAADAKKMAGGMDKFDTITKNIVKLVDHTYVTVGVVITDENVDSLLGTIELAHSLGVADIRVISAAQQNKILKALAAVPSSILGAHPILKYRVTNAVRGRNVRGIHDTDSKRCWLALDDMAVANDDHYPCIIYMREKGAPIGKMGGMVRKQREKWVNTHDCFQDPICRENCLDVCVDYNNVAEKARCAVEA